MAEHEQRIAEVQQQADEAAAAGDVDRQKWHLDHIARFKAMPYPWEQHDRAAWASITRTADLRSSSPS